MTPESQEQEMRAGGAMCPIHGEMDPTWTRCPQCIREGRDGRLVSSSGYGAATAAPEQPARPATPAPGIAPSAYPPPPPVAPTPAPGMPQPSFAAPPPPAPAPPPPAIRETVPEPEPPRAAPAPAASSPAPAPAPPAPPPVPAMGSAEHPVSSVGGTVVIRRKPRALAFLIEKEGEQVGRVFQLEQDITDIGRDPRNHVVVGDVLVSGFHARLERSPSGDFVISDRGSTNGSRLNGEPLNRPLPFHENDEFGLGNTTLVLKVVG